MGINGENKEIKESSNGLLKIIQSETTILKTNYSQLLSAPHTWDSY
jgi:hypothetical protein